MFTLYKLFDLNGWGWYVIFSFVHALNGWLLYKLSKKLLEKQGWKNATLPCLIGTGLFLLSPYQAEVLVWKVCFHYLLSGFFMLTILSLLVRYLEAPRQHLIWSIHALFFLSLFTLEMALITPLMIFTVMLWWNAMEKVNLLAKKILLLITPQILLITAFLFLNKIRLHDWMGHYGSDVHLKFKLTDVLSNYFRYFEKYLFFTRYFDHSTEMKIFGGAENITGQVILTVISIALLLLFFLFYKKFSWRIKAAGWYWILFSVALLPVLTLYMVTLLNGENDRYGYVASMFFWMMLVMLISSFPKKIFLPVSGMLLGISIFLLVKTTTWWADSNRIYYSLLNDFRWYDRDQVIVLNIPDNYHGLYMYRIYRDPSSLKEGLELIRRKPFAGDMHDVVDFNMMTPNDGVHVKQDSAHAITMQFNQYGNWWWREGIGASDYENDVYKVHIDGGDCHVQFKNLMPNHAIILPGLGTSGWNGRKNDSASDQIYLLSHLSLFEHLINGRLTDAEFLRRQHHIVVIFFEEVIDDFKLVLFQRGFLFKQIAYKIISSRKYNITAVITSLFVMAAASSATDFNSRTLPGNG